MERYMPSNSWHQVSSPVVMSVTDFVNQTSNNIPTSGNNYGMEFYNELAGKWEFVTTTNLGSQNFTAGTGFLARTATSNVVTFTGSLNYGTINTSVANLNHGWNSIGNPYSSSLRVSNSPDTTFASFLKDNFNNGAFDPNFAAIYMWNGSGYTPISNAGSYPEIYSSRPGISCQS